MDSSLYIHIPFCISKCAYCDFFSKPSCSVSDDYIAALCHEIEERISYYKINKLTSIYIGGGTPSLLSLKQFETIFNKISKSIQLSSDIEITVEVNPDDVSKSLLQGLGSLGVTRISCGIQSMSDKALKKACRRANLGNNRKALELFKNYWYKDLSLDLIAGLPEESEESLLSGLAEVCKQKPDHLSLYSLTIEENTPFGKEFSAGRLSYDFDKADKLWLKGRDFLEEQGYLWYEVSNFALPGKECRHNLAYWNHQNYLGCGSGACGTIYSEDGSAVRWSNTTKLDEYISWWTLDRKETLGRPENFEKIDLPTSQFEYFMMGLRKLKGISEKEYRKIFNQNFPESFTSLFNRWENKGLCIRNSEDCYAMSRQGMLFLNRFLEEL